MHFLCSFSFSPNSNNNKIDILHNNFRCLFRPWTNNAIHINTFTSFILKHDKKRPAKVHRTFSFSHFASDIIYGHITNDCRLFCGKSHGCSMHLLPHHFQSRSHFPLHSFFPLHRGRPGIQHETHFMIYDIVLLMWKLHSAFIVYMRMCEWKMVTSRRILEITK